MGGGGWWGVLVPVPKIGPPKAVSPSSFLAGPSHPHLLAMWVCVPVVLSAVCCLAEAPATNTATARRLTGTKTYRAAAFFPSSHFLQYKSPFLGPQKNLKKNQVTPVGVCGSGVKGGVLHSSRSPEKKNICGRLRDCYSALSAELWACQTACLSEGEEGGRENEESVVQRGSMPHFQTHALSKLQKWPKKTWLSTKMWGSRRVTFRTLKPKVKGHIEADWY